MYARVLLRIERAQHLDEDVHVISIWVRAPQCEPPPAPSSLEEARARAAAWAEALREDGYAVEVQEG